MSVFNNTLGNSNFQRSAGFIDFDFSIIDKLPYKIALLKALRTEQGNVDFKYIYVNNAYIEFCGSRTSVLNGLSFTNVHQKAEPFWIEYLISAWIRKEPINISAYTAIFDKNVHIHFNTYGNDIVILSIDDISKFKKLEYKFFERRNKLKIIFNTAPIGFGTAVNRSIVEANNKLCQITGYSRHELIGKDTRFLYSNENYYDLVNRIYDRLLVTDIADAEVKWKKKDGSVIDILISISCLSPFEKNRTIVFTVNDITKRKAAEKVLKKNKQKLKEAIVKYIYVNAQLNETVDSLKSLNNQLIEANIRVEESNKLKTAFLQNISHEIRTPMNAIIGFAQLLERCNNQANRNKYIEILMQNGHDLLQILDEIIEISMIETKQAKLNLLWVDLNNIIHDVDDFLNRKAKHLNKDNLVIKVKPVPITSDLFYTDPTKIQTVFKQLANNALKYTESGVIEFGVKSIDSGEITFFVSDTGKGIPEKELANIFEQFRQVEISDRTRSGLGIGLAIVSGLVRLMNGQVCVESKIGIGSVFYFKIPDLSKIEINH